MTNNLNVVQILDSNIDKYAVHNTGLGEIDAAITAPFSQSIEDATDPTVMTTAILQRNVFVDLVDGGTPPANAYTVELPAIDRGFVMLRNSTAQDANIKVTGQVPAADILVPGEVRIYYGSTAQAIAFATTLLSPVVDYKDSVRVATTAAGTLASSFENGDTVDGIVLSTGDSILIKDQAAGGENGIYTVNASGAPTRRSDCDTSANFTTGLVVFVEEGTENAKGRWQMITTGTIVVGTTATVWEAAGGSLDVREGNVSVLGATKALDFDAAQFIITDEGSGRALVTLDAASAAAVAAESKFFAPPLAADFATWVNQGSAVVTDDADHGLLLKQETTPATGDSWRSRIKTAPTAPWKATMRMKSPMTVGTAGDNVRAGFVVRENTSGEFYHLGWANVADEMVVVVSKWTNNTTLSSDVFTAVDPHGLEWFEVEDNNTDIIFRVGTNPTDMQEVFREARTTFLTPDRIGFGVNDEGDAAYLQVMFYEDDDNPASGIGVVHDVSSHFAGNPAINTEILTFIATRGFVLPVGLAGSEFDTEVNPSATWVVDVKKNRGAASGTISFSTGGVATPTFATAVSFAAGDILTIETQGTTDGTVSGITSTLAGLRT
jgi:hypothetical protein